MDFSLYVLYASVCECQNVSVGFELVYSPVCVCDCVRVCFPVIECARERLE